MNEVQRYLVEEFVEGYHERVIDRRELLRRAIFIMGGVAGAAAAIREAERALAGAAPYTGPVGAWPGNLSAGIKAGRGERTLPPAANTSDPVVAPDDPEITTATVSFPGEAGTVGGYLARPRAEGRYPGVVVIHENQGLTEPHLDIARRFAKEGFAALAVDMLSRVGGTASFPDNAARMGATGQLGPDAPAADGNAGVAYLLAQPFVSGAVGAIGYCFGGGVVWRMGVRNPNLRAIAPHYGSNPPLDEVPNLRAAALGIYAENDTRITSAAQELAERLAETGKTWEFWVAPGAGHAFFNNIREGSPMFGFQPEAAREAWVRTLAWFDRYLA